VLLRKTAATSAALFRYMLWQGSNVLVAILLMLMASAASTIHWLARPHVFTYLLFAVSLWALEADRRQPSRWIFGLAPLAALWTNLHGGFAALVATAGVYCAGSVLETWLRPAAERDWRRAKRYGLLVACIAPLPGYAYGYHLHRHIPTCGRTSS
jgi:hypothetical protein